MEPVHRRSEENESAFPGEANQTVKFFCGIEAQHAIFKVEIALVKQQEGTFRDIGEIADGMPDDDRLERECSLHHLNVDSKLLIDVFQGGGDDHL